MVDNRCIFARILYEPTDISRKVVQFQRLLSKPNL